MRVLELYSGIGGMHSALKASNVDGEVVASVDINQVANAVYKHNFPNTMLLNRNIQSLKTEYINALRVDTILMSPPCQPFTRNGLKEDINDSRTDSFLHILNILPKLEVQNVLIENVKGFETSETRNILIRTLQEAEFLFQEFILSPTQFGVPNTRHRYYCVAKRKSRKFQFDTGPLMDTYPIDHVQNVKLCRIRDVLELNSNLDSYISKEVLRKRVMFMDICHADSKRSCCFTKSYGRYVTGTGSVYTYKTKKELDDVFEELKNYEENTDEYLNCLNQLRLRFFTPREMLRLMSFPETFEFPKSLTYRQKCMLIGNSINVKVVAAVIKLLTD